MILNDVLEKIKRLTDHFDRKETATALIIILSASAAFALGRLSRLEEDRSPLAITEPKESNLAAGLTAVNPNVGQVAGNPKTAAVVSPKGSYVASKTGTKYHFYWCPGAKTISDANKVWFQSAEDARAAGYTPASNCKGLK